MRQSIVQCLTLGAALVLSACTPPSATDPTQPLVGSWACTGESGGTTFTSHFDYLANGRYISRQRISLSDNDFIEGGGGGTWRLEGDILYDTKTEGRLDRFMRAGVEVPSSDPEFQQISAGTQENLGAQTQAQVNLEGDRMIVGFYTCERER